ncbi:hypothetical protein EV144_106263 [Flavobacterium sp. 270]|uniref:hypothetical protein n=1 Tax=Flavobacterium sp. 270 TaxID=2512114 RepID=UPI0010650F3A|nr:hypothetical protein [Flavobacterium sp. 270]TDW46591.1 hypothetical protein EV144_106263 [Flavobacterium sp. 270]
MKKIFLIIVVLFFSCQKKDSKVIEKAKNTEFEKGEYFSPSTKKESFVLKYKTDTLNLYYDGNQLKRVEKVFFSESFGGDGTSGYERIGYHINKENFLDANVYITDTLKDKVISDYPIEYEERYEFYRKTYSFSYSAFAKKKIDNYFKSSENPSKGYTYDLMSLDVILSKIDFSLQKMPKSLYNIKNNDFELFAGQDSLKVYDIENTNNYKMIHSSIPFYYSRDVQVKKVGNKTKYFAKISLKGQGNKYIDLKEIESIQASDPHLDPERFVTAPNGLEMYDNTYSSNFFGNKEYVMTKIPYGTHVDKQKDYDSEYRYINGRKGNLVYVTYYDDKGESYEGIAFSGYLSINKPD